MSAEKTNEQNIHDESVNEGSTYTGSEQVVQPAAEDTEAQEGNAAEAEDETVAELRRQLDEARNQAEENQQRLLRMQADYDNFRRRSRQEKEEFAKYANLKLIEGLLPVVDNFDRALQTSKDNKDFDAMVKGIEMVYRQFDGVLRGEGLSPIDCVGQPFNPELHQAIMQVESDEHEEGIVVEEVQKGYKLGDKVVRPSMVKVSM